MTATAWNHGLRNMAMGLLILFVVGMLVVYPVSKTIDKPFRELAEVLLFVLVVGMFILGVIHLLVPRPTGGKLLLDCGTHPHRRLLIGFAALMAIMLVEIGLDSTERSWLDLQKPLFQLMMIVYFVQWGTGRLEFREGGIYTYLSLTPWDSIRTWSWSEDSTLLMRRKGWLARLERAAIPVPPEQQADVDALLRRYCPVAESNPD